LTNGTKEEHNSEPCQPICGGNARDTVKALIVANEFLEGQVA
jgi:hypothetical protein